MQKKKECSKYKLSEQPSSPRLGGVHSFSSCFIMASEQMLSSGAESDVHAFRLAGIHVHFWLIETRVNSSLIYQASPTPPNIA